MHLLMDALVQTWDRGPDLVHDPLDLPLVDCAAESLIDLSQRICNLDLGYGVTINI